MTSVNFTRSKIVRLGKASTLTRASLIGLLPEDIIVWAKYTPT